jgi:hypothetical protein
MSTLKDAISAIREVLLLTEKVNSTGMLLSELAKELRGHDRRLIRIETMIEIAQTQRLLPPDEG